MSLIVHTAMSFSNSCVLWRKDFHLNRLFYLLITLLNHLFVILMVRVIACNSKAVSFSSICICPEKVYKPKLIFYSISQPNHLHLILYNNFYSLYIVYDVISVKTNIFLGNVQVTLILTNYHLRTNLPRLRLSELQLESVIMTIILYNNFCCCT